MNNLMITIGCVVAAIAVCSMTVDMVSYYFNVDLSLSGLIDRVQYSRLNRNRTVSENDPDYIEALKKLNDDENAEINELIQKYDSLEKPGQAKLG